MKTHPPEFLDLIVGGQEITAQVSWNAKAKRLIMRVEPHTGKVCVTLPTKVPLTEARKFLSERTGWILDQLDKREDVRYLSHNANLDFLGKDYRINFTGQAPRSITIFDNEIHVGGPGVYAAARLQRWLKQQAKDHLVDAVTKHSRYLGLTANKITIGDTKSRWGSCSSQGNLRFSWRLVMAPFSVLNYVAAHEVAHLEEMNHSQDFWSLVNKCDPNYKVHRKWLKENGQKLFCMGAIPGK